jgi:hypothetical protein
VADCHLALSDRFPLSCRKLRWPSLENVWLDNRARAIYSVFQFAKQTGSSVVFAGDTFEAAKGVPVELLGWLSRLFDQFQLPVYFLAGNHELRTSQIDASVCSPILDLCATFPNVHYVLLPNEPFYVLPGSSCILVSYDPDWERMLDKTMQAIAEAKRYHLKYLFSHAILPGAVFPSHVQIPARALQEGAQRLLSLFRAACGWGLKVILGDVHKRQNLFARSICYVGALLHCNFGEADDPVGFFLTEQDEFVGLPTSVWLMRRAELSDIDNCDLSRDFWSIHTKSLADVPEKIAQLPNVCLQEEGSFFEGADEILAADFISPKDVIDRGVQLLSERFAGNPPVLRYVSGFAHQLLNG